MRLNLIGPNHNDIWRRHFLDSAQLHSLLPSDSTSVMDIGSGAGFPGMVLAILGTPPMHLVDSNHKKIAFLREVASRTSTTISLHTSRIENLTIKSDIITSRALATLSQLLHLTNHLRHDKTQCIFLKGKQVMDELAEAEKEWYVEYSLHPSITDSTGKIVIIHHAKRL